MTKEMKIKHALIDYEDACKLLNEVYNERFTELPVDEFGQVSADDVLELNMWCVQEKNALLNQFVNRVMSVDERNIP